MGQFQDQWASRELGRCKVDQMFGQLYFDNGPQDLSLWPQSEMN